MPLALLILVIAASPGLEEGRLHVAHLEYAKAVAVLRGVADDPTAPAAERVEAFDLLARSQLALGDPAAARSAYDALLGIDPMAAEPVASPKVRAAFKAAKEARFAPRYLALVQHPSAPDLLEAEVVNPWRLPVTLELWQASTGEFEQRVLPLDGARIHAALPAGTRSYLRAVGSDGVVLATLGSPSQPLAGPPAPPPLTRAGEPKRPADAPTGPKLTPAEPAIPVAATTAPPSWTTRKSVGLAGILVGAALLAAGIVLHVTGSEEISNNGINAPCFPFCSGVEDGQRKQAVGVLLGALGLLAAGGGTYLLVSPGNEFGARSRP